MPERIAPDLDERGSLVTPIIVALFVVAGGGLWFYSDELKAKLQPVRPATASQSQHAGVFEQLGVASLPPDFERANPNAARLLDQLRREPCDGEAILPLVKLMSQGGYPREAATSALKFGERCGQKADLLEHAYHSLVRVRDLPGAVNAASELIKIDQARGRYRYLRGFAHEELKNFKAALSDYVSTLQLFTSLSNVAASEFYRVSRMYTALGRPCDAITPLEIYLSYDVAKRQTAQLSQLIKEYANSGDCRATYASGSDKILIPPSNIIPVIINGAQGRMIVDTGASMVALSPSFASRARILPDESNLMTFQVVGGTIQSAPGNAQLMEVGNTRAANVPVAISIGNASAYGPDVDGLLGMTFLARFNVTLSGGALELKPRDLN